jgi:hypothetical protein
VEEPPEGDDWIHEIKLDGYRTQLVIDAGEARAHTRRGADWTAKYRPLANSAAELPARSAIIDGEMADRVPETSVASIAWGKVCSSCSSVLKDQPLSRACAVRWCPWPISTVR